MRGIGDRTRREGLGKTNAVASECVESRGLNVSIAITVDVVGDHGEGLGEHHEETHGIFLYDSTTHVPLIVKLPGQRESEKVVAAQVRTIDILPTALDLIGVSPPESLDGKSLTPYFAGNTGDRVAIGETDYPLRFGWSLLRSVRANGLKYIEAPRPEFYDLHADPGELSNLYQPTESSAQKMRTLLPEVHDGVTGKREDVARALPDPKDKIEEQNLLHRAMMASDENRMSEARSALEKALKLDANSPTALRQLGELEFQAQEYGKAADHLKRARQVRPQDSTAAFIEGQALDKTGDLAGARDALEESLKLVPSQFEARLLLGQIYLRLYDAKAAEDQFQAALLLQPKSADAAMGKKTPRVPKTRQSICARSNALHQQGSRRQKPLWSTNSEPSNTGEEKLICVEQALYVSRRNLLGAAQDHGLLPVDGKPAELEVWRVSHRSGGNINLGQLGSNKSS